LKVAEPEEPNAVAREGLNGDGYILVPIAGVVEVERLEDRLKVGDTVVSCFVGEGRLKGIVTAPDDSHATVKFDPESGV